MHAPSSWGRRTWQTKLNSNNLEGSYGTVREVRHSCPTAAFSHHPQSSGGWQNAKALDQDAGRMVAIKKMHSVYSAQIASFVCHASGWRLEERQKTGEVEASCARFSNKINCKRILREIAILQRLDSTRSCSGSACDRCDLGHLLQDHPYIVQLHDDAWLRVL